MATEPVSVLQKVTDLVIAEKQFTPDGESKPVTYKRLLVLVEFDGVTEELEFVPSDSQGKLAYRILALADDQVVA